MHHHTGADAKCRARGRLTLGSSVSPSGVRGCSSMVEPLPSKQITRVRFPSSAPQYGKPRASWPGALFCSHPTMRLTWVRQLLNRATQNPQPKGKGVCRTWYQSAAAKAISPWALDHRVSRSSSNSSRCQVSVSALVLVSRIAAVVREGQESAPRRGARLSWTDW